MTKIYLIAQIYLQIQISHPEVFYWSKREARVGSLLNVKHPVKIHFFIKKHYLTSFTFNDLRNQENTQCTPPRLKMTYPLPQVSLSSDVPLTTTHCVPPHVSSAHPTALPPKISSVIYKNLFLSPSSTAKKNGGEQERGRRGGREGGRGGRKRKAACFSSISPSSLLFISPLSSLVQHADGG